VVTRRVRRKVKEKRKEEMGNEERRKG